MNIVSLSKICTANTADGSPCKRTVWEKDVEQLFCHAHSPKVREEVKVATEHKNSDELVGRRMRKQDPVRYQKILTNT